MQYRVDIYQGSEEIQFESYKQVDVFVDVVKFLIQEHGLLEEISLPYVPGEKKALINDEPYDLDSSKMYSYKKVDEEVFLNVNYNRREKKLALIRLASELGLDIHFEGWDQ